MTPETYIRERNELFDKEFINFYSSDSAELNFDPDDTEEIHNLQSFHTASLTGLVEMIREMVLHSKPETMPLEPYVSIVQTGNMDAMFDWAYQQAISNILSALPNPKQS